MTTETHPRLEGFEAAPEDPEREHDRKRLTAAARGYVVSLSLQENGYVVSLSLQENGLVNRQQHAYVLDTFGRAAGRYASRYGLTTNQAATLALLWAAHAYDDLAAGAHEHTDTSAAWYERQRDRAYATHERWARLSLESGTR